MSTDVQTITALLARYCFVVDRGTADDIAELFWEDCVVDFAGNVHQGRPAAREGFDTWIRKRREPIEGLRHLLHTPHIAVDGDTATAEAYYDADGHSKGRGKLISLRGRYQYELEKRAGEWRMTALQVEIWRSALDSG